MANGALQVFYGPVSGRIGKYCVACITCALSTSCQYVRVALGVWAEGWVVDLAGTRAQFGLAAFGLPAALFHFIRRLRVVPATN